MPADAQQSGDRFNCAGGSQNINTGSGSQYNADRMYIGGESNAQCLADLRETDPRGDKARIERTKGGLLQESYLWILDHSDYRSWHDSEHGQLLWIKGSPGTGKTMLLCGIIEELMKLTSESVLLSYFFCEDTDSHNTATSVLRGLLYLLVSQQDYLLPDVEEIYKHAGRKLFEDKNAWDALLKIFEKIMQNPGPKRIYLIIDALDECKVNQSALLGLIQNTRSRVKWIFSSRNDHNIERQFNGLKPLELKHTPNADFMTQAINAYIKARTVRLRSLQDDPGLLDRLQGVLRHGSDGTFLWVARIVQELDKLDRCDIAKIFNDTSRDLDWLHARIKKQSQQLERSRHRLASSSADLTIKIWDVDEATGNVKTPLTLQGDKLPISGVAFSPDSRRLASCSMDGKIKIWDAATGEVEATLKSPGFGLGLLSFAFSPDGRRLASGTLDGKIKMWDLPKYKFRATLGSYGHWVLDLVATLSIENFLTGPAVKTIAFSPDSRYLASGSADGNIKIWDVGTDDIREAQNVRAHLQSVEAVAFSPDGRRLASGSNDRTIKIWDVGMGNKELRTLQGHRDSVNTVEFSPEGRRLASGSSDCTIRIWDAATDDIQATQALQAKGHRVRAVAFSLDGRRLASGSYDSTIRIWDIATGETTQTLRGHGGAITAVVFSPDGRHSRSHSYPTATI